MRRRYMIKRHREVRSAEYYQHKVGVIRVELEYEMPYGMSNSKIMEFLQRVELPSNYSEDTYQYVGIWNKSTTKWENDDDDETNK